MIDSTVIPNEKIQAAAREWSSNSLEKYAFIAGAEWALVTVDPLCAAGADIIMKHQEFLKELREFDIRNRIELGHFLLPQSIRAKIQALIIEPAEK